MMAPVEICHEHNLNREPDAKRRFGVRVRLAAGDPLKRLIGGDFACVRWFASQTERDRALADLSSEHLYSRRGDRPTLTFERVDRS
jgi:hypothetical protein